MKEFSFKTQKGLLICNENNIIKIISISNYSKIYFDNNTTLVIARVLKRFESIVTPGQFIRINQSVLININQVKLIDLKNKLVVSHFNDESFRISKGRLLLLKGNPPSLLPVYNKTVA